jgi:hypothetical protein
VYDWFSHLGFENQQHSDALSSSCKIHIPQETETVHTLEPFRRRVRLLNTHFDMQRGVSPEVL